MKVLVIAPHPDDEILGCGGLIARYASEGKDVYVCIATKGYAPLFNEKDNDKDIKSCKEACKLLGVKDIIFLDMPAAQLDTLERCEVNSTIDKVIKKVNPDEIYIPHIGDMHIDHKIINEACMVSVRPRGDKKIKRVYAYETLSETGWDVQNSTNVFIPNTYVDITKYIDKKVNAIKKYKGQLLKYPSPRSIEGIKSLAIYRGTTVNLKYAEGYMLLRETK